MAAEADATDGEEEDERAKQGTLPPLSLHLAHPPPLPETFPPETLVRPLGTVSHGRLTIPCVVPRDFWSETRTMGSSTPAKVGWLSLLGSVDGKRVQSVRERVL